MNAPTVPSATSTANAQTASNINTATAQSNLNDVNQVTPYGNLTYSTTGKNADGTPIKTATQTLSPAEQQLLNTNTGTLQNLSNTGSTLANQIGQNAQNPIDFSQQQSYLNNLTSQNLDPVWNRDQSSLNQQLANEGLNVNDEAYKNAQTDFSQNKSQAYNAANSQNYQTALQGQLSLTNQPVNELSALLSQSQVQNPTFGTTPSSQVGSTDVSGLTSQQYQDQLSQYNSFWNGVGDIGSSVLKLSDKRLKTDISTTGVKTPDGIPMKTFRYKGSPIMHMGVIAQDVEKKRPDAVRTIGGKKAVDYGKINSPMLALGVKRG